MTKYRNNPNGATAMALTAPLGRLRYW